MCATFKTVHVKLCVERLKATSTLSAITWGLKMEQYKSEELNENKNFLHLKVKVNCLNTRC